MSEDKVTIVFLGPGDLPFVSGAWAALPLRCLDDIEKQVQKEQELYLPDSLVPRDFITGEMMEAQLVPTDMEFPLEITYLVQYVSAQIGGYPPRIEAPGYWDLKIEEVIELKKKYEKKQETI